MQLVIRCAGHVLFDLAPFCSLKLVAEDDDLWSLIALQRGFESSEVLTVFAGHSAPNRALQSWDLLCDAFARKAPYLDLSAETDEPTPEILERMGCKLHKDEDDEQGHFFRTD